jgi:hypothetical protein
MSEHRDLLRRMEATSTRPLDMPARLAVIAVATGTTINCNARAYHTSIRDVLQRGRLETTGDQRAAFERMIATLDAEHGAEPQESIDGR